MWKVNQNAFFLGAETAPFPDFILSGEGDTAPQTLPSRRLQSLGRGLDAFGVSLKFISPIKFLATPLVGNGAR